MEIGASLAALELFSSHPRSLADFYAKTFGLAVSQQEQALVCRAQGRELRLLAGPGGQLHRASYRFRTFDAVHAHRAALRARGIAVTEEREDGYTVLDPEGRRISFLAPRADNGAPSGSGSLPARLQHFALRSPSPARLLDFYVGELGFVLSDRVLDAAGELTAAFLRTDAEHHSLALFRAPESRFDHFSCEAPGWQQLRDWADHMASTGTDLAWGIGRHGPGNDTFLMVRDQDGNMAEISSDLEVCRPGRPAGVWPHRPQTLNRWGVAIMRS